VLRVLRVVLLARGLVAVWAVLAVRLRAVRLVMVLGSWYWGWIGAGGRATAYTGGLRELAPGGWQRDQW